MGLDITAIRKAVRTENEDGWRAYNANGVNRMDGKLEGRYTGEQFHYFRAGSYGGYNEWRDWLSITFLGVSPDEIWKDPDKFEGKPFVELINFGDNEGTIGPITSAKLAKDFQNHAVDFHSDEWFAGKYHEWQKAFEMASDDGFVIFH